jgi:hypothetical protein
VVAGWCSRSPFYLRNCFVSDWSVQKKTVKYFPPEFGTNNFNFVFLSFSSLLTIRATHLAMNRSRDTTSNNNVRAQVASASERASRSTRNSNNLHESSSGEESTPSLANQLRKCSYQFSLHFGSFSFQDLARSARKNIPLLLNFACMQM